MFKLFKSKFILLFFLLICIFNLSAQNDLKTKEIKFKEGVYLLKSYDAETKNILSSTAIGKNVSISYIPSLDDYSIIWEEDKKQKQLYLIPKETSPNGMIHVIGEEGLSEEERGRYYIQNTLNENGKLLVIFAYPIPREGKKYIIVQSFEGFN